MAVFCWHFGRIVHIAYHVITGSVIGQADRDKDSAESKAFLTVYKKCNEPVH